MKLKRWLKDYGYRARFVAKTTEPITSSVLLSTNKVLTDGFELCLLSHPKNGDTLWGVTLAIQDYAGFAERDYGRPRVNKKKGMLPPKLARIMVNLAELPEKSCIWDPFCGSGTVLMETLLLGYSVIGTDIDQTSVDETKENLAWLCDTYWISHTQYQVNLHDIRDGVPVISEFDGIVTEPYLGPILRSAVSVERMESIVKEIQPLYEAIERITHKKSTVKKKRAVIVVPGFKTDQGWIDMDPSFESAPHIDDLTQKISSYPLQWDRPNSIIRRNLKIYAF